jgi:O-antigen/teichoic acid export membrane protein
MKIARNRRRTTIWNLFFHYFSVTYAIVSGILLVPLYLKFISLDLYGAWLATSAIVTWIAVVDPGLSNVLMQRVSSAYGRSDHRAVSGLITNGVLLSSVFALLILLVGLVAEPLAFAILKLPETVDLSSLKAAFVSAVVGVALMNLSYGVTSINQGLQSSLGIGLISAATMLSSIALTVWLLFAGYGVLALPLALVFRGVGLCVGNAGYLIWRLRAERVPVRLSFSGFRDLVTLLSYTFWGRMIGGVANNLDAVVIARLLGPEAAPVLLLTRRGVDLSRVFLERPATAFMPAISNLFAGGEIARTQSILVRLLRMIFWLTGLAAVGFLTLNESFVQLWVGGTLFAGSAVNLIIVLGLVASTLTVTLSNLCLALGNIKGNSLALLAQSLITIPLMILGGWAFGMPGVALAPTMAILCISSWYYPRTLAGLLRFHWVEFRSLFREIAQVAMAALMAGGSLMWLDPHTWASFIVDVLILTSVYGCLLFVFSKEFRAETTALLSRIDASMRRG